jgi:chromate transporter
MDGAMSGMKPVLVGMIAAAALLLMFPSSSDGASFIDPWSWVIFGVCSVLSMLRVNPILLIALSAVAGVLIYV